MTRRLRPPAARAVLTRSALAALAAGLLYAVGMRWEADLAPVLGPLRLDHLERRAEGVVLAGSLPVLRDCVLVGLDVYVGEAWRPDAPRERLLELGPDALARDPASASARLGPVAIPRPVGAAGPSLVVAATHRCHPLWRTTGVYYTAPLCTVFGEDAATEARGPGDALSAGACGVPVPPASFVIPGALP